MGNPTRAAFTVHHKEATTNGRFQITVAVTATYLEIGTGQTDMSGHCFGSDLSRRGRGEGNNEGPVEKRIPTTAQSRRCSHGNAGEGLKQKAANADGDRTTKILDQFSLTQVGLTQGCVTLKFIS